MTLYIYNPSKHRRSGTTMQKKRWRGSGVADIERHEVCDGFPKTEPFQSRAEVDRYFDDNAIECLLCGKRFEYLAPHITRIHYIDSDDYRKRFGIPKYRGLAGKARTEKMHIAGLAKADHIRTIEGLRKDKYGPRNNKPPEWESRARAERIKGFGGRFGWQPGQSGNPRGRPKDHPSRNKT